MKLDKVERLVHLALGAYLVNVLIMLGLAVWSFSNHLTLVAALTVGRTMLSAFAVVLLLIAVRQLRIVAEVYQDHCRFLRQMVLVMMKRAVEQDPAIRAEIEAIEPPS